MENDDTLKKDSVKDDDMSLREFIQIIKNWKKYFLSKWIIIASFGMVGGVIGFTYAYLNKPLYVAELSFALEDANSSGLGGTAGLASQLGFDIGGGGNSGVFSGSNLIALMQSRSMVEKALLTPVNIKGKTQTLAELYISFNDMRKNWENDPKLKNIQFLPSTDRSKFTIEQDSILGVFHMLLTKNALVVEKKDKLTIITVNVKSANELFSKLFAEVLTTTVSDFYVDTKTKKSVQNVSILQHQTDSVRRELNEAISGVASFIDAVPNANPTKQILRVGSQHRQVDVQADQAILTELVRNLEVSKISLRKETPLIQVIDTPILPLEKIRLRKLIGIVVGGLAGGILAVFILFFKKLSADFEL